MSIDIDIVRIIGTRDSTTGAHEQIVISDGESLEDYQDKVILNNRMYKEIFGETFSNQKRLPWKRGIVRISCNKRQVYRMYAGRNDIKVNEMAVTRLTLGMLEDCSNEEAKKFIIEKGKHTHFRFYWEHPVHSTRVSFKLGVVSVLVTVVLSFLAIFITIVK